MFDALAEWMTVPLLNQEGTGAIRSAASLSCEGLSAGLLGLLKLTASTIMRIVKITRPITILPKRRINVWSSDWNMPISGVEGMKKDAD